MTSTEPIGDVTAFALDSFVFGATSSPTDRARASIGLAWARQHDCLDDARRLLMRKRAEYLTWLTRTQRHWQASVSRRPARGRHHDSWKIRESYVRCTNGGSR